MATQPKLMSATEFSRLPDDGMEHELVRGELRTMPPPGFRHEETAGLVMLTLGPFIRLHELGRVVGGPGFRIERKRSMAVYRSASDVRLLGPDDQFDGADVLPSFRCRVRDLFPS